MTVLDFLNSLKRKGLLKLAWRGYWSMDFYVHAQPLMIIYDVADKKVFFFAEHKFIISCDEFLELLEDRRLKRLILFNLDLFV